MQDASQKMLVNEKNIEVKENKKVYNIEEDDVADVLFSSNEEDFI